MFTQAATALSWCGRQTAQHGMLPQDLVSAPQAETEKQTREDLRESQSHLQNQDRQAPKLSLQSL